MILLESYGLKKGGLFFIALTKGKGKI